MRATFADAAASRRRRDKEAMATSGLEVFDSTLQQTHIWLQQIMTRLGRDDRHRAYLALRTVLHALRDRLPPELAVHLGAQLPMLVRGFYYEGWRMGATPNRERHKEAFLEPLRHAFSREPGLDPEPIARAVFAVLAREIDPGEVGKVVRSLPAELRELWPDHIVEAALRA
jgi:uncharacterized protein (DUF2267 family)